MKTVSVTITRTEATTLYFQTSLEDDDNIYETVDEHINALENNAKTWHRFELEWDTRILDEDSEKPDNCGNFAKLIGETET